jgi:acyl phosphate:glycerol-3-phosphate acyltransferase
MSPYFIAAAVGYLLGSIPFGYLLVRVFKGEDVRTSGSGNIGATNVARKSPVLGGATLLLDVAKGLAAVLIIGELYGGLHRGLILNGRKMYLWDQPLFSAPHQQLILTTAAFFAVFGHLFPVWLKFHGGKGVATSLGAFILLTPKSILCMLILFLVLAAAFRYISLGSVAAAAAFPLLAWAFREYSDSRQLILIALIAALVIWKHRKNIGRLVAGTESKLKTKSEKKTLQKVDAQTDTLGATRR